VITHLPTVLLARFVGGDVKPLIDLPRVGDDDLPAELKGEVERNLRLADARGPEDYRDSGQ